MTSTDNDVSMLNANELRIEGFRSENIFSEITTAWYDYCLAKELNRRGAYCWAIEASYYSALHALRAIMHISKKLTEYFFEKFQLPPKLRSHKAFIKLLTSYHDIVAKEGLEELIITDIINELGIDKETVKGWGVILKAMKKIREIHVYQHLIIAHQVRVVPVKPISDLMVKAAFKIVKGCTDTLVERFLNRIDNDLLKYCYIKHFSEEIDQFKQLLELENIKLAEELEGYIDDIKADLEAKVKKLSSRQELGDLEDVYQRFVALHRPTTHFNIILRELLSKGIDELKEVLKITETTNERY